jgi:PleD family two-component response regulator
VDKSGRTVKDQFLTITMPFGVAQLSKHLKIKEVPDWVGLANHVLYSSKNNGRNRTTLYVKKAES